MLAGLSFGSLGLALGLGSVLDLFGAEVIEENLIAVVCIQIFKLLVDLALQRGALIVDCPELHRLLVALFFVGLELRRRFASFLLDVGEELEEILRILLQHLFRAHQAKLAHFIEVGQTLNLLVLLLEEHLYEEHLSFLLDQIPAVLPILGSFDRHVEARVLSHIDLVSDVGVDGEGRGLNVSLTQLAEAAFSCWTVLFPDLKLFVLLPLALLSRAFLVLERKDPVVTRLGKRICMLFKA